jgi:MiaB-like tRNA modifying enzyme
MRVYCETFGCTMNRGDTEAMLGCLAKGGHESVQEPELAEVLIVNTCAVKGQTQKKVLRRLAELKERNGKPIVVAGCLPLVDLPSIERLGSFACITSCRAIGAIDEIIERISNGESNLKVLRRETDERPRMPKARGSSVSAIVAMAEGCLSSCSYCSVKLARGDLRSHPPGLVVEEATQAIQAGYKEIKLTAQDTAAYGADIGADLPALLKKISSIPGEFKIRVGMMNPTFTKHILLELLDAYKGEKVYKFLHIPVQSGDDGVLSSMRRGYTVDEFLDIVQAFRETFEDLQLSTDVIVGLPGEGEVEFAHTCELVKKIRPDNVNVSRFTPMPNTDAAKMPQVEGREVAKRSRALAELWHKIGHEINKSYVGRVEKGLVVEAGGRGGFIVRLSNYKPVIVQEGRPGEFVDVKIVEATPTYLKGVLA